MACTQAELEQQSSQTTSPGHYAPSDCAPLLTDGGNVRGKKLIIALTRPGMDSTRSLKVCSVVSGTKMLAADPLDLRLKNIAVLKLPSCHALEENEALLDPRTKCHQC
ncbi:hypothetical protein QTP86_002079 [Hemibagrus guttatus]|nr:hypothetical protein QTP86_002079 [Hemibagrus guttatus]